MAALPMLINAMRNIGQAAAMQSMAEQLGNSAPVAGSEPPPQDAAEGAKQAADAAQTKADEILDLTEQDKAP